MTVFWNFLKKQVKDFYHFSDYAVCQKFSPFFVLFFSSSEVEGTCVLASYSSSTLVEAYGPKNSSWSVRNI